MKMDEKQIVLDHFFYRFSRVYDSQKLRRRRVVRQRKMIFTYHNAAFKHLNEDRRILNKDIMNEFALAQQRNLL